MWAWQPLCADPHMPPGQAAVGSQEPPRDPRFQGLSCPSELWMDVPQAYRGPRGSDSRDQRESGKDALQWLPASLPCASPLHHPCVIFWLLLEFSSCQQPITLLSWTSKRSIRSPRLGHVHTSHMRVPTRTDRRTEQALTVPCTVPSLVFSEKGKQKRLSGARFGRASSTWEFFLPANTGRCGSSFL